jgi:hypothetical protein
VTKPSPSGSALEYSTYLGGAGFSFEDGNGLAVDREGSAYVTGFTASAGFPTTPAAPDQSHDGGNDAFVAELDRSGAALGYSTFLGGAGNGIAVDGRTVRVAGSTTSADFPAQTQPGGSDAFVIALRGGHGH